MSGVTNAAEIVTSLSQIADDEGAPTRSAEPEIR